MPAPKNLFLESKDKCRKHLALVKSNEFEEACVFALADFAADCPSKDELEGARKFLHRFVHLAESDEENPANSFAAPRLIPPEQLGQKTEK